jgi:cytochrome b561/polyisoprenoid-binding protein YceI
MTPHPRLAGAEYAWPAIVLHWLIALAIVFQVTLAWRMGDGHTPLSFATIQLHKSVGISIFLLSLLRLALRLSHRPPPLPTEMARWERTLAHVVHVGFYAATVGLPMTGWLMVSTSPTSIPTLLFNLIRWPSLPLVTHLAAQPKAAWNLVGQDGHLALAYLLYGLFGLHVAGALKHQILARDEPVLARMAPGAAAGRWWEPRLSVVAAGVGAAILLGVLVHPMPAGFYTQRAQIASSSGPTPAGVIPAPHGTAALPAKAGASLPGPKSSAPIVWLINPGARLSFATSWGGQPIAGRFERWNATVRFSPDDLKHSQLSVVVDLMSARTGDDQRDAVLPTPDWFDAASHPKAIFTTTAFERVGGDRYVARGRLALRGVTRSVVLPFTLRIVDGKAWVEAETTVDRTAFGVGQGEFQATDQVPGEVAVKARLTASPASSRP